MKTQTTISELATMMWKIWLSEFSEDMDDTIEVWEALALKHGYTYRDAEGVIECRWEEEELLEMYNYDVKEAFAQKTNSIWTSEIGWLESVVKNYFTTIKN